MSVSTSAVAAGEGFRPPFTAGQWQELEHQALIYKYLVAGLPVPPDLVIPIRMSAEALSARFFHHPTLGYCSYYGKKFDPEPGRCRRTDGKKWRCSKDAYPDSKYCERHMHRGRNRSRKPVESQPTSSQSLSTAISHAASVSSSGRGGTYQQNSGGSVSFQNPPLYSMVSSDSQVFGSNISKLDMEPVSYGINNKEYRYIHGVMPDVDEQSFSSEAFGIGRIESTTTDSTWRLMTPQVHSSSLLISRNNPPHVQGNSSQLHMPQSFEPTTLDSAMSKQRQQHCFFASEIGSPGTTVKQEPHLMRSFFDEWPKARESWSDLDEGRSNNNITFSTTQLSISIPMAHSEFSARTACSPDGADA